MLDRIQGGMEFCDMICRYATWPEEEALDGSAGCRTFQAVFCKKKKMVVHKNAPCPEKEKRSQVSGLPE